MKLLGLGECVCGAGERGDNRTRERTRNECTALVVSQEREECRGREEMDGGGRAEI